jgi:hypothetical protein
MLVNFQNSLIFGVGLPVLRKSVGFWLAASSSGSTEALSAFFENEFYKLSKQFADSFVIYEVETACGSSGSPILSKDGTKVLGIHHTQLPDKKFPGKRVGTRSCAMLEDLERASLTIPEEYGKQVRW